MFPQDATILIPQQQPFVMVDDLIFANGQTAKTSFKILDENPLCINGVFQESGLLENMAQTAAVQAGFNASQQNTEVKKGFIALVSNFEVWKLPNQGDLLSTTVSIIDQIFGTTVISGQAICNDQVIASADMKIFLQE